jgi:NAD(P)-dependent dehydrogenase (short-subunit alcohol dehydrogenase family)
MMQAAPKTIIVAGSESLIGKSVAGYFARRHQVLGLDLALGHDLTREAFVRRWFAKHHGDYLINLFALNDHIGPNQATVGTLFDIPLDSFRKYLEVNLTALFSVCREFARNNAGGGIVNFSSTYGLVSPRPEMYSGSEKHVAYGVSKAGVIQLSRHLAVHLAPQFRVNCIVPGGVRFRQSKEFQTQYAQHTPLRRMMEANELHGILGYLCSDDSSYTTGAILPVDGGWTAI